jgi:hypothetical protein
MADENVKNVADKGENLLSDLHTLLEEQIRLAHKGDMTGVESLSTKANSIINSIIQRGILDSKDFEGRRCALQKLYEKLSMTISAQKVETGKQLSRIRKGKKTVAAYRGNI